MQLRQRQIRSIWFLELTGSCRIRLPTYDRHGPTSEDAHRLEAALNEYTTIGSATESGRSALGGSRQPATPPA